MFTQIDLSPGPSKMKIHLISLGRRLPLISHVMQPSPKLLLQAEQLSVAEETISLSFPADQQFNTDGSTLNGTQNGETVSVVYENGRTIHFGHALTGAFSSLFHSEKSSLIAAISRKFYHDDGSSITLISTVSQWSRPSAI